MIDGKLSLDSVSDIFKKDFSEDLIFLKKSVEKFDKDTEILMAKSQALFDSDQLVFDKISNKYFGVGYSRKFEEEWIGKLELLQESRKKILKESTKEIESIKNSTKGV